MVLHLAPFFILNHNEKQQMIGASYNIFRSNSIGVRQFSIHSSDIVEHLHDTFIKQRRNLGLAHEMAMQSEGGCTKASKINRVIRLRILLELNFAVSSHLNALPFCDHKSPECTSDACPTINQATSTLCNELDIPPTIITTRSVPELLDLVTSAQQEIRKLQVEGIQKRNDDLELDRAGLKGALHLKMLSRQSTNPINPEKE